MRFLFAPAPDSERGICCATANFGSLSSRLRAFLGFLIQLNYMRFTSRYLDLACREVLPHPPADLAQLPSQSFLPPYGPAPLPGAPADQMHARHARHSVALVCYASSASTTTHPSPSFLSGQSIRPEHLSKDSTTCPQISVVAFARASGSSRFCRVASRQICVG